MIIRLFRVLMSLVSTLLPSLLLKSDDRASRNWLILNALIDYTSKNSEGFWNFSPLYFYSWNQLSPCRYAASHCVALDARVGESLFHKWTCDNGQNFTTPNSNFFNLTILFFQPPTTSISFMIAQFDQRNITFNFSIRMDVKWMMSSWRLPITII